MLLHPAIYENALRESNFYSTIDLSAVQGGEFIKIPDGVEYLVNGLLENFLSYVRGETDEPNLKIQIDRESVNKFFNEKINEIPQCETGMSEYDSSGNPVCKSAGKTNEQFLNEFLEKKNVTLLAEDSVDLSKVYNLKSEDISRVRGFAGIYKMALYGLIFLTFLFSALIIILFFDSLSSGIRTLGIDFFIGGISVLPATFLMPNILTNAMNSVNVGFVSNIAQQVAASLIFRVNIYAYISIAIGIVFLGISFVFSRVGK